MAATNKEYLQPPEITIYYDVRRVIALLSDSGIPITQADLGTYGSSGYAQFQSLVRATSALIDSRCQQGKRYDRTDLEGIAYAARTSNAMTDTDYEAKQKRFTLLQQLTADLFFGDLISRRGHSADMMKQLCPRYELALERLEQLYNGVAIFDLDAPKNAGIPTVQQIGKNRISSSEFNRMFGIWPAAPGQSCYGLFGSWRY